MFRLVNKGHHKFSFVGSINLFTMHSTFLYEEGLHMVAGCEQFRPSKSCFGGSLLYRVFPKERNPRD